ncbi:mandelate racemase/muconate lactonizing enzyme family protein, partial [Chloroflexota bacterium]
MKITKIEVIPANIPWRGVYVLSYGVANPSSVIVKMHTDSGIEGAGEVAAMPGYSGADQQALVSTIRNVLAPPLIGADPLNIRRLHEIMDTSVFVRSAARSAKAALDMAAYDIAGKALGVPVSTLLGGAYRDRIPVYASSGGVGTPEEAAEQAQEVVDKGFTHLKMKGSKDPWLDFQRVAAIRKAVGDEIDLRVDPNLGYISAKQAIPALKAMEAYNITMIEDPLPSHDYYGMLQVSQAIDTPLTIHQGLVSPEEAANLIHYGVGDIFNICVPVVGGLYEALKILAIADSFNIPVLVGSNRDTSIGDAASAHFASVIRDLPYACDCR